MLRMVANKYQVSLLLSNINLNLENRAQTFRVLNTKTFPEVLNYDLLLYAHRFLKIHISQFPSSNPKLWDGEGGQVQQGHRNTHLPSPIIKKKSPLQNTDLFEVHRSFNNTNYFLPVFQAIITFKVQWGRGVKEKVMRICIRTAFPFNCLYSARASSLQRGGEMRKKGRWQCWLNSIPGRKLTSSKQYLLNFSVCYFEYSNRGH